MAAAVANFKSHGEKLEAENKKMVLRCYLSGKRGGEKLVRRWMSDCFSSPRCAPTPYYYSVEC